MAYKINVTERADELLDNLMYHLIFRLKNKQAAKHLLDCIDVIYDRLEVNPFQFAECGDLYLARKGYREAVVSQMNYIIIFDVRDDVVNVVGIFHQLENYPSKLEYTWGKIGVGRKAGSNYLLEIFHITSITYPYILSTCHLE